MKLSEGWPRWILRGAWLVAVWSAIVWNEGLPWDPWAPWLRVLVALAVATAGDSLLGLLYARLDAAARARRGPSAALPPPPRDTRVAGRAGVPRFPAIRYLPLVVVGSAVLYLVLVGVNEGWASFALAIGYLLALNWARQVEGDSDATRAFRRMSVVVSLSLVGVWSGILSQDVSWVPRDELARRASEHVKVTDDDIEVEVGFPIRRMTGQHWGSWMGSDLGGSDRLAWERGLPVFWANWFCMLAAAWFAARLMSESWLRAVQPWTVFAAILAVLTGGGWLHDWGLPARV